MEDKKDLTLFDLERQLEEQLSTIDEDYNISEAEDKDDRRHEAINEIIDGLIPIYNYDLLTVACSNLWLGEYEPEGDVKTAHECLREAIYSHLLEKAGEIMDNQA